MSSKLADRLRNDAGEVDYHCPQNHHVYGDNILWRSNGSGTVTPACRECRRAYRAEHRKRPEVQAAERARYQRKYPGPTAYDTKGNAIPLEEYLGTEKRSVPWNLLRPSPEASAAFDEFHEALKYTDVPCRGREQEFTEFVDPRSAFADDNEGRLPMPTREQARRLCKGCPLFDECGTYARLERPDFGIHAGHRWVGRKII